MNHSVVVIGIPESGKSSFIAALSHILEFGEIETVLSLAQLPTEARYLFEMRSEWHGCQPFERTKAGFHPIVLNLRDQQNNFSDLSIPDIAGEEFEQQWSARVWNEAYLKATENASGVLLFVNAKSLRKPYSLADVDSVKRAAMALVDSDDGDDTDEPAGTPDSRVDPGEAIARQVASQGMDSDQAETRPAVWEPRKADEQAKLVDLLQSLVGFAPNRTWRLGIVVSAWDLVRTGDRTTTPRAWIEKNLPLLRQYLESNASSFDFEVFGVSAQGGDPVSEAGRLQTLDSQSERVMVVARGYEGHDLTRVVAWVTSGNA